MKSYVYIIYDPSGLCKIGKANNVKKRLSTLQIGNPRKLLVYYKFTCKSPSRSNLLEKLSHAKLAPFRLSGEWFNVNPKSAKIIIKDICNEFKGQPSNKKNRKELLSKISKKGKL